jgi:hypothetical protein
MTMAGSVLAAIIAVFGAVCLGYVNSFIAEDFRRFRDGSALAAGLAGELASYAPAIPILRDMLQSLVRAIDAGKRSEIRLRSFDRPVDLVFEQGVGKLGLLGSTTVESSVFVYGNLRAFRMALEIISKEHADMADAELRKRCVSCLESVERAVQRGETLLPELRSRAAQPFKPNWPWGWSRRA